MACLQCGKLRNHDLGCRGLARSPQFSRPRREAYFRPGVAWTCFFGHFLIRWHDSVLEHLPGSDSPAQGARGRIRGLWHPRSTRTRLPGGMDGKKISCLVRLNWGKSSRRKSCLSIQSPDVADVSASPHSDLIVKEKTGPGRGRHRRLPRLGRRPGHAPNSVSTYANAKVLMLGDSGVGKSGLAMVLAREPFQPTESTHARSDGTCWMLTRERSDAAARRVRGVRGAAGVRGAGEAPRVR